MARGPLLIKCGVEGAELLVLRGARNLLASRRPTLLMSVDPPVPAEYRTSRDGVAGFIRSFGYDISIAAIDHEEHWSGRATAGPA